MRNSYSSFLTMNIIKIQDTYSRKRKKVIDIAELKISYIDIEEIVKDNHDVVRALKDHVDNDLFEDDLNSKYTHDLFYIAPLYHRKFSNLEKFIFIDIDIMFNHNVNYFWRKLDTMSKVSVGRGCQLSVSTNQKQSCTIWCIKKVAF